MLLSLFKKIQLHFKQRIFPPHLWREILCVFFAGVAFFALLVSAPSFPDPDSFYHARIAAMMAQGPLLSFPWLPLTSLAGTFIDHHFLYHILLIPFVVWGEPLIGIKIATTLFAAAFIALFYWLMRKGVLSASIRPLPSILFVFLLLINTVFTFRLNLAKIPAVSLFVFFCGILAVCKKNNRALFGISFLFVWLYGGWPLMPLMATLAWLARSAVALDDKDKASLLSLIGSRNRASYCKERMSAYIHSLFLKTHVSVPLVSLAGAASGLIINPYFPTNIFFYWVQTIKIAVLNIITDIPVGSEWYPPGMSFVPSHGPTLMILIFAVCVFFLPQLFSAFLKVPLPKRSWQEWLLCLLSLSFFVLTLKSRRYGEYFAPLATLFCASVLSPFLAREPVTRFLRFIKKNMSAFRTPRGLATAYLLVMIPAVITTNTIQIISVFADGYGLHQYERGMAWLSQHTPENSLVFHHQWDDFPLFFYHNQHNQYISGLDPRFLLEKNAPLAHDLTILQQGDDFSQTYGYRALCTAIDRITRGKEQSKNRTQEPKHLSVSSDCIPLQEKKDATKIMASFGSPFIVVTHLEDPPAKKIRGLPGLQELYHDDEMAVLKILNEEF